MQPDVQTPEHVRPSVPLVKLVVAGVAYVLFFVGFLLQLVGVGEFHDDCNSARGFRECEDIFRADWWATFFQLLVALSIGSVLLLGILEDVRTAVSIFLTVATVQLINRAEVYLDRTDPDSSMNAEARTAATGYIFSAMGDFLLVLIVGVTKVPQPTMKWPQVSTQWPQTSTSAMTVQTVPVSTGDTQMTPGPLPPTDVAQLQATQMPLDVVGEGTSDRRQAAARLAQLRPSQGATQNVPPTAPVTSPPVPPKPSYA